MKIHITNYQRLENIEINLKNGINLISGSSNNGKSSTIRAIRDFLFNKISKDKIRHGENELTIEIDSAKATRNNKGVVYEVDNNKFEKVGRNILPEIKNKFNIDELNINGVSIKPNFWFQMDKPFLSDKTPGQKNDLLIGSKNDKYIKALKNIKAEQNELSKVTKKSLEEVIDMIKKRNLDKKKEIDALNGIEELVNEINLFEEKNNNFNMLLNYHNIIKNNKNNIEKYKELLNKQSSLKWNDILEIEEKRINLKNQMNDLYNLYKNITSKKDDIEKLSIKLNDFNNILNIDLPKENYTQKELLVENLEKLIFKNNNLKDNISFYDKKLKQVNDNLNLEKIKFDNYKKEIGICPLCGGKL